MKRLVVDGSPNMSQNSPHVHSSRMGTVFFDIRVNAYVAVFGGIGTNVDLRVDGGAETCMCSVDLVSLERKVAATTGPHSFS